MIKVLAKIIEVFGWLRIMASPLLIGLVIGVIIYDYNQNITGAIISISVAILGLIIGIIWATKVWKSKQGTIQFLSRIMATPELEKNDEQSKNTLNN